MKKKKPKISTSDKILLSVFILMIIVVIILVIVAVSLKNNNKEEQTNIVIPIIETNSKNEISVNISEMKKGEKKEYIFKITNYKDKEINNKVINYTIDITPSDKASIKLYKNNNKKDNLTTNDDMLVENNKLIKNKRMEDEYRMIITVDEAPEKNDVITVKIES